MEGVRLEVGLRNAIPHPAAPPEVEAPAAQPAPGPAPPVAAPEPLAAEEPPAPVSASPAPRRGNLLARLLRRPAERLRAYLTASTDDQLHREAVRTVALSVAVQRIAHFTEAAHAAVQEVEAAVQAGSARLALQIDALEQRLTAADAQVERVARSAGRAVAIGDHHTLLLERQYGLEAEIASRVDAAMGVIGMIGPRFDELDIKVRPLVPYDAQSTAVRVADGYLLLPRSEPLFTVMVADAGSGGLEPGVRQLIRALLQPGAGAVDVGANVGLLTLAMARAVGPGGRVRAFEPEARVREQLAKTLHLNGLAQVRLSGAAVGAEAGRLVFHQSPVIGHSSLYALPEEERADARPVEVEVVRLDDVVPEGEATALVKIDVEGAELDVLHGMPRLLAANPGVAVLAEYGPSHLLRVGIAPAAWFAAFVAHGLEPHLIGEPDGRTEPTSAAALEGIVSANLVFVRPGGAAAARLLR